MDCSPFLHVTGVGALLATTAGCSSELPAAAVQAWQGPPDNEPDLRRRTRSSPRSAMWGRHGPAIVPAPRRGLEAHLVQA